MFTTINIDTDGNVTQIQSIVQIFFYQTSESRSFHNFIGASILVCMG